MISGLRPQSGLSQNFHALTAAVGAAVQGASPGLRPLFRIQMDRSRVSCVRDFGTSSRAGHPGDRRCSSLKYTGYSRSSRLGRRAPRAGSRRPKFRTQETKSAGTVPADSLISSMARGLAGAPYGRTHPFASPALRPGVAATASARADGRAAAQSIRPRTGRTSCGPAQRACQHSRIRGTSAAPPLACCTRPDRWWRPRPVRSHHATTTRDDPNDGARPDSSASLATHISRRFLSAPSPTRNAFTPRENSRPRAVPRPRRRPWS